MLHWGEGGKWILRVIMESDFPLPSPWLIILGVPWGVEPPDLRAWVALFFPPPPISHQPSPECVPSLASWGSPPPLLATGHGGWKQLLLSRAWGRGG